MEIYKLTQTGAEVQALLDKCQALPTREQLNDEIAAAYHLPDGGIPRTDLSEDVRGSLALADSALQTAYEVHNHGDLNKREGDYQVTGITAINDIWNAGKIPVFIAHLVDDDVNFVAMLQKDENNHFVGEYFTGTKRFRFHSSQATSQFATATIYVYDIV